MKVMRRFRNSVNVMVIWVACTFLGSCSSTPPVDEVIYYTSYQQGFSQIYELRTASGEVVNHSNAEFQVASPGEFFFPNADYAPSISPRGVRLVFASSERPDGDLFVRAIGNGDPTFFDTSQRVSSTAWSFDGRFVAYAQGISNPPYKIFAIDLAQESQQPFPVTFPTDDASDNGGLTFTPQPGGIVFSRKMSAINNELLVVNLNTPDVLPLQLTDTPDISEQRPRVSMDGRLLAYVERRFNPDSRKIKVFPLNDLQQPVFEFDFSDHPLVGNATAGLDFTSDNDGLIVSFQKQTDSDSTMGAYELYVAPDKRAHAAHG